MNGKGNFLEVFIAGLLAGLVAIFCILAATKMLPLASVEASSASKICEQRLEKSDDIGQSFAYCELAAQQMSASATQGIEIANWVMTILTGVGVVLLYFTLRSTQRTLGEAEKTTAAAMESNNAAWRSVEHSRSAVEATRKAASQAADTARRELRAYLAVVPDGINQLIGRDEVMGHVLVRNVGKLPAGNVTVTVMMKLSQTPEPTFDHRETHFPVDTERTSSDRTIQPGNEMRQGSQEKLNFQDLQVADYNVYVWGVVRYEDGYGEIRITKFCHRYATASRNLMKATTRPETTVIIGADKARYHHIGNSAE